MVELGYKLCSEERSASDLVDDATRAEDAGFSFLAISDHFHPWTEAEGQSPFVWSSLGAIAASTSRVSVGTAVTCPSIRMHPALIAQAAATTATLLPHRFFLGVGTGENLNEHVVGAGWPNAETRRRMLKESVDIIRSLWSGELVDIRGEFHTVQDARLYSLPDEPPPIYVAASGPEAAELAAEIGDGLICSAPNGDVVDRFLEANGSGPCMTEILVSVDDDERRAMRTVLERWPLPAVPGELTAELPLVRHFEQAAGPATEEDIRGKVVLGGDPARYLEAIQSAVTAGYDHVFLHQVGADQTRFFRFAEEQLLPKVGEIRAA
jgi:G6PDH family F420-dependent oxidoreductase